MRHAIAAGPLLGGAEAALYVGLAVYGLAWSLPGSELMDFGSFVASGRAAAAGLDPYGIYELTFRVWIPGFDIVNPNLNPPAFLPFFDLLGRFEPHAAFRAWYAVSVACYAGALWLLRERYGPPARWGLWAVALAGLWDSLALGQIYLPLVLIAVAAWLALERGRTAWAGLLIGALAALKPNFLVWPALLFLSGSYRPALAAAAAFALLNGVALLLYGPQVFQQWLAVIAADPQRAAFPTNASLLGLGARIGLPNLGRALAALLLAGLALWAWRRRPAPVEASAAALAAAILASPIGWVHYTLFLLPALAARRWSPALRCAALLLTVPVAVPIGTLEGSALASLTAGSVYNWAMLAVMSVLMRTGLRRAT